MGNNDHRERLDSLEASYFEIMEKLNELETAVDRNARILDGDPALNVPQMRLLITRQAEELQQVKDVLDRVKWVGITLGIINGSQLMVALANLFGR